MPAQNGAKREPLIVVQSDKSQSDNYRQELENLRRMKAQAQTDRAFGSTWGKEGQPVKHGSGFLCRLIRSDSAALRAVTPLFDLILSEAERDETTPSPLIERLTELLFFYVIPYLCNH